MYRNELLTGNINKLSSYSMCVKLNMIHFQLISANELELKVLFFVIQCNLSRVSTEKMGKLYYFYIVHNYTLLDENVLPGLKKQTIKVSQKFRC